METDMDRILFEEVRGKCVFRRYQRVAEAYRFT